MGLKFTNDGINFVKSESFGYDGRIDKTKFAFIDEKTHAKLFRSQLKKDDILFSMAGIYLGKTALVSEDILPANTNQALAIIRLNQSKALPQYVRAYLSQSAIIELINNFSGQSAQPNINFEEISSIPLILPPLPEQRAIAGVLSNLDDKIDLLHQQNKTLEDMAQTLWRKMFVEEADTKWEEKGIDEIATFLNGLPCQKYPPDITVEPLPVIKIKELRTGITDDSDLATSKVPSEYIIEDGDILFSWSGSLEVVIWSFGKGVLNQHLFKVTSDKYPKWFYYYWIKHHLAEFRDIAQDKATTMGHIQRHHLSAAKVLIPDEKSFESLNKLIDPTFKKIIHNLIAIRKLIHLRDILLPKLMSGEVRVDYEY